MKLKWDLLADDIRYIAEEAELFLKNSPDRSTYYISAFANRQNGYLMKKDKDKIIIQYGKLTDFCRALMVAAQQDGEYQIEEKKHFGDFGYMVDCSRNAVPKVDTLKTLIKRIAFMGYDFLGLYIEDTIKVEGEPYLGYMRGAYSKQEIREVANYAAGFGIEVRPYVQTLAHFNQIKRYEEYQNIIDTDDILLVGDESTYEFLERYIKTIAEGFQAKKINIGMDEAHMVGLGKYLDRNGYKNRFNIMYDHLEKVTDICKKYGLQPQMWSDMFFRLAFGGEYYIEDAELKSEIKIPKGLELVYWDYYSCDEERYDNMLKRHKILTEHIGFAGGAWKWTGFAPHNQYSLKTSKAALTACIKNNLDSVVITGWGDNGAEASLFSTLPALYFDANMAYESKMIDTPFYMMTGIRMEDYMLVDIVNPFSEIQDKHNNASKYFLYNDPLIGTFDSVAVGIEKNYYYLATEKLKECINNNPQSSFIYLFQTLEKLCRVLECKLELGIRIRKAYISRDTQVLKQIAEKEIPELQVRIDYFYHSFMEQWYLENKTFGFEIQSIRIGGLKQRLTECAEKICLYLQGKSDFIDELEEEHLPFHYFEQDDVKSLNYNLWSDIISPAVVG